MSPKYVKIFFGPAVQVINLCNALDEVSIVPVIKDRAESARLAGFGCFLDVFCIILKSYAFSDVSGIFSTQN